jgi:hypothetical protein
MEKITINKILHDNRYNTQLALKLLSIKDINYPHIIKIYDKDKILKIQVKQTV